MEKCRLRVFKNKVLRKIFQPKEDELTGDWRKLLNVELGDLYSLQNIIGLHVIESVTVRWVGHVTCRGERRGPYWILVGKPEGKRPLGRPRHGGIILNWIIKAWDGGHGVA
jgi:hypothetical protein